LLDHATYRLALKELEHEAPAMCHPTPFGLRSQIPRGLVGISGEV